MSIMGFVSKMGIAKVGQLGDAFTTALVQFDPETATKVQIDDMAAHCRELAARVAQAQQEEERFHASAFALSSRLSQTTRAAGILGERLKADPSNHTIEAQLTTLLNEIETIGGPEGDGSTAGTLFEANQDHAQAESDFHEWQTVHTGAAEALANAERRLMQAKHDMVRAAQTEARAKEKQAQAEHDAGLRKGLDASNIALSAMQKAAEEAKTRARAATINADALRSATGTGAGSADDIVKAALASTTPPTSALDRLAKLTKAA